jgi:DNA mismatch endonuclease, patch repair protein
MADIMSKKQRSLLMSRIRGKNNKGTELVLASLLRKHGITGWRRHLPLPGTPDFTIRSCRLTIFLDGCFWHGCPSCARNLTPSTNTTYWSEKIVANRRRDRRANRALRKEGWQVLRIWEHDLKKRPIDCVARISRMAA